MISKPTYKMNSKPTVYICNNTNTGDTLWFCGFINGKDNSIHKVKTPNSLKILQASCDRRQVICVMEGGGCWQYNVENRMWKNLEGVICTEQPDEYLVQETVVKVCCGETLTAVLTSRGTVYNLPNKLIIPGVKVVNVACGRAHILMLSDRGEVYTSGEGSRGQLGHGELEDEEEPRLLEGLAGLTVVEVACGGWHSCAITSDGDLYSWGWNMAGQLGLKCKVAISRWNGSCLELGDKVSVQAIPLVVDWPGESEVRVSKVACGARHTVILLENGSVWGCGWNKYGQLALPDVENVKCMTKLPTPHENFQHILCGPWNTCLIT